ncbi:hypothetical protein [Campylobacter sp. CCUG 57310]|uniref:hypothetical protein n=1 Tax=Campylobacter sp. CCUG 57310 TaxID=2517362 RepID=UPI0015670EC4|nr:hypothetical protein [Campylobacter sp. CCUG 57310]QKF91372.1 putative membrane protein [Campylobacter sp. CCUG 57310]
MKYRIISLISHTAIISLIIYDLKFANTQDMLDGREAIALFLYAMALVFDPDLFVSDEKYVSYIFAGIAIVAYFIDFVVVAPK